MKPTLFKVVPMSMPGQSLLQWDKEGERFPRSIQMETEIAKEIVALSSTPSNGGNTFSASGPYVKDNEGQILFQASPALYARPDCYAIVQSVADALNAQSSNGGSSTLDDARDLLCDLHAVISANGDAKPLLERIGSMISRAAQPSNEGTPDMRAALEMVRDWNAQDIELLDDQTPDSEMLAIRAGIISAALAVKPSNENESGLRDALNNGQTLADLIAGKYDMPDEAANALAEWAMNARAALAGSPVKEGK